jgi:hypothetical protein
MSLKFNILQNAKNAIFFKKIQKNHVLFNPRKKQAKYSGYSVITAKHHFVDVNKMIPASTQTHFCATIGK